MKAHDNSEYVISHAMVQLALDNMLYSSGPQKHTSLTELTIIQDFLSDSLVPKCKQEREFALNLILVHCIREQFIVHRRAFSLVNPDTYITQFEVSNDIATGANLGNPELIGWAWLYYRYVRVDLYITAALFSQNACIDPRSLRRYHQHSIRRLTDCLIEYERAARTAQRQRIIINSDLEICACIAGIEAQDEQWTDSEENKQILSIPQTLVLSDTPYLARLEARVNFLQTQLQSIQDEHNQLGKRVKELARQLDETKSDFENYLREWA